MGFKFSTPIAIIGVAILYYFSARLGLLLSFENTNASPVWPPSGLGLACAIIFGRRILPGIWIGAFAANMVGFYSNDVGGYSLILLMSASIATGNMLEAIVGRYFLAKVVRKRISFTRYEHVFWFFIICFVAAFVSSTVGVATLLGGEVISSGAALYTWQTWILGDASGMAILTPVLLFLSDRREGENSFGRIEFWVTALLVMGASWYIFILGPTDSYIRLKAYFLIPLLMWAAFRFTQREMATLLAAVSALVIVGTIGGGGPFADSDLNRSLVELQSFIVLISISFLALSATLFDQKRAHSQIETSRGKLEQRVMERTGALTAKIQQLEKTEGELAIIKQEFIKACELAHLGHFQWDTTNDTLFWSDQVYEIFGVNKSTFQASFEGYNNLLHPLDKDWINEVLQTAYRTHEPYSLYHRIIHQESGKVRWVNSKGSVVTNAKGDVIQMIGTVLDVSELKEKELLTDHLVSVIEHSADAIMSISVDGIVTSWNKTAEVMHGISATEIIGNNFLNKLVADGQKDIILERIQRVKQGEVVTLDDVGTRLSDGSKFNLWLTYAPIRDVDDQVTGVSIIMRDMTERKEKEDNRFKLIVDSAPNVMLLVNQFGKMEIVNSQAEKMFGYKQEELLGQPIEILLPERFRAKHPGQRGNFFADPHARSMGAGRDLFALHKNGSEIPVEIGLNPIETPEGTIVLAAIIDITERKKMEEARREQEVVQETVRLKDQFMANMSHEIRTPMNAIVGFTDLLDRTNLRVDQKEYLEAIKSSGINLLTIINDILDLSKIRSGKIQVERTPMSVHDIGHNICEIFGQKAKEKGLELRYFESPEIPQTVWGDPVRLSQIFMNLISNALKFTEHGFVEVGIRTVSEDEKTLTLDCWVKDTGIGIQEAKMESIFDRFTQASSDTTRKYGGTGLGLSIVKGLVDIQGGSIVVTSEPGEGSTFTFQLKYEKFLETDLPEVKTIVQSDSPQAMEPIAGLRVLLVEDNRLNQKLAITVLTQAGCTVDLAETGQEAVDKLPLAQYDVVLMDIQMPVMDGYKATKVIRNDLKLTVPIIAMTAHAMAGERDKCLSLGMNDYLSKPFQREQLINVIKETVARLAV